MCLRVETVGGERFVLTDVTVRGLTLNTSQNHRMGFNETMYGDVKDLNYT